VAREENVRRTELLVLVEGAPIFTGFIRDITERKRAEDALHRTENLYRQAIIAADAVPYLLDYKTESFAFIGEGILDLTGYSAQEMTPALWKSLAQETIMRGEAVGSTVEEAIRLMRTGAIKHWQSDCAIRTRDGSKRWVADSSIEMLDEGGDSKGSIGILMDITERKQLEEQLRQLQKMESIGQLAAGVAHDFNNILAAVLGNSQLALSETGLSPSAGECLTEIKKAAVRARGLIQQILAFSRQQPQEREVMPLGPLVHEVAGLLRATIPSCVEIIVAIEDGAPPVLANSTQMHQVLVNLCKNAIQAMTRGGVLTLCTEPRDDGVCLVVKDTGGGIPQDLLSRIWGHLPDKLRDQMQASLSEQFLPKYEQLIEDYYRRLAEDRSVSP